MRKVLYVVVGLSATALLFLFVFMMGGNGGDAKTPEMALPEVALDIVTSGARFWILFVIGACVLAVWAGVNYASCPAGITRAQRVQNMTPPVWAFAILLGVTTFHWLSWAISPESWSTWLRSSIFWPMNLAILLAVFFVGRGGLVAWVAGIALGLLTITTIGISTSEYFPQEKRRASAYQLAPVAVGRLPAEVALPIIAECESGGRQFDDEGNLIRNLESSAIGKYQIMASLHEEKARGMGLDSRTEAGNEAYAKFLYQESGTQHWEADSRSRACWEPKLAMFSRSRGGEVIYIVKAGKEWTETYHFPPAMTVEWRALNQKGRFAMRTQDATYTFTPEKSDVVAGVVAEARFMALGESPENIRIRLYR